MKLKSIAAILVAAIMVVSVPMVAMAGDTVVEANVAYVSSNGDVKNKTADINNLDSAGYTINAGGFVGFNTSGYTVVENNSNGPTVDVICVDNSMVMVQANCGFGIQFNNEGGIVTTNNAGINDNKGTVTTNNGTITSNNSSGTVTTNNVNGTVKTNKGTVTTNKGNVTSNGMEGIVTTNEKTITTNHGTVTTNAQGATVTDNESIITTNNGYVEDNFGTITKNDGTIERNAAIVTNNYMGTINDNTLGGVVTMGSSAAKVKENYGTVINASVLPDGSLILGSDTFNAVTYWDGATELSNDQIKNNTKITIKVADTKLGYKFVKWTVLTNEGEQDYYYVGGEEVDVTSPLWLEAVWEEIKQQSSGSFTSTPTSMGSASAPLTGGTWTNVNGVWTYTNNGEKLINTTAWIQYTNAQGQTVTQKFCFDNNGKMITNAWKQTADGVWNYFGADGAMLVNTTTPDGYVVDANGNWVKAQ